MSKNNAIPELSKLIEHARNIVFDARRQGTLDSLTVNGVKKQLELQWSLDQGTLNTGQYKKTIGDAVRSATTDELPGIDNVRSETKATEKVEEREVDKQPPYEDKPTSTGIQKKTTDVPVPPPVAESSRSAAVPVLVKKKVAKMPKPEDRGRRDFALNTTKTVLKINERTKSNSITSLKKPFRSREYIEDDEEDDSAITDSSGNGDRPSSEGSSSGTEELERSRKRRKRPFVEEITQKSPRKRPRGDNDSKSSEQDEVTIKKFKAYVGACGLRKKWSKEFENCPQPTQQIRHLKKILADLGMEGKYSMEKAKQIRKKRDLERELEDVIDFERKAGVSRARRRKSGRPVGELDTETESDDDNDESDSDAERRRPASAVIKKYLTKQRISDSDEE